MNNRMQRDRHSRRHRRTSKGEVAELQAAVPETNITPPRWRPRLWLVLLLCLAGSSLVSFVVFKHLIEPTVPPELVGSWEVTAGPMRGATLDFHSDGTAEAVMYKQGRKATTHSTARVEGK